eukprot:SAG31_NODE_4661_length_3058_cov_2.518756_3_plen_94_part_00
MPQNPRTHLILMDPYFGRDLLHPGWLSTMGHLHVVYLPLSLKQLYGPTDVFRSPARLLLQPNRLSLAIARAWREAYQERGTTAAPRPPTGPAH